MKLNSQKGQGMLEYALLLGFIAALAIFVFAKGGFGYAMESVFGTAGDSLTEAGEATSFDYETLTAEDIDPATYKTLNWQEVNTSVENMYGTIMGSDTVDKAIKSETNLFADLTSYSEGHLASTNASDGTKDWETFLSNISTAQAQTGFTSSYKRGEETFTIQRLGNSNTLQARYSDGKEVIYYRFSPDANNVMQIETNSDKSFREFMTPIVYKGGWEYDK